MDYDQQVEKIREIAKKILPHEVTILTGKNGCGKSLVRKLVGWYITDRLRLDDKKPVTATTSMQQRTESRSDFGAFSSIMHDQPDTPTSYETLYKIKSLFKSSLSETSKRFIVVDEPEIGMGEELVAALCERLNSMFNPLPEHCLGILVITHNRYLVEHLKGTFLNFDGMTREEWLNRKIVPTDIDTFEKDSDALFHTIQARLNAKD